MENKKEEIIEAKIDEITNNKGELTESQKDRLLSPQTLMMEYLNTFIQKIQSKNRLKSLIEKQLIEEIENIDNPIDIRMKLRIYEILCKTETDNDASLLSALGRAITINVNQDS